MVIAAILVAVVSLAGFLACAYSLRTLRNERHRAMRAEIVSRIGNHGIWVGAWLVGIDAAQAEQVKARAVERAGLDGHKQIAELWAQAGGRVLTHVRGPDVVSEAEACGWLAQASDALAGARVPGPLDHGREEVFALVYASTSPPPVRTRLWRDLQVFLNGPGVLGAAFVACPAAAGREPAAWRATAIGSLVLLVVGLLATAFVAVWGFDEPRPARSVSTTPAPVATPPSPASAPASGVASATPTLPPKPPGKP